MQLRAAREASQLRADQYAQSRRDYAPFWARGVRAARALEYLNFGNTGNYRQTVSAAKRAEAERLRAQTAGGGPGQRLGADLEAWTNRPIAKHYWDEMPEPGELPKEHLDQLKSRLDTQFTGVTEEDLKADPGYKFRQDQAAKQLRREQARLGMVGSGQHQTALANYQSKLASQEYGNVWNRKLKQWQSNLGQAERAYGRLSNMAGVGFQSTSQLGNLGYQTANAMAGDRRYAGEAQAASAIGVGHARVAQDAANKQARAANFNQALGLGLGLAGGVVGGFAGMGAAGAGAAGAGAAGAGAGAGSGWSWGGALSGASNLMGAVGSLFQQPQYPSGRGYAR